MYRFKYFQGLAIAGLTILSAVIVYRFIFESRSSYRMMTQEELIGFWQDLGESINGIFSKRSEIIVAEFRNDGTGSFRLSKNNRQRLLTNFTYQLNDSLRITVIKGWANNRHDENHVFACMTDQSGDSLFLSKSQYHSISVRLNKNLEDLFLSQK